MQEQQINFNVSRMQYVMHVSKLPRKYSINVTLRVKYTASRDSFPFPRSSEYIQLRYSGHLSLKVVSRKCKLQRW